jgi:hypothetical protein
MFDNKAVWQAQKQKQHNFLEKICFKKQIV